MTRALRHFSYLFHTHAHTHCVLQQSSAADFFFAQLKYVQPVDGSQTASRQSFYSYQPSFIKRKPQYWTVMTHGLSANRNVTMPLPYL